MQKIAVVALSTILICAFATPSHAQFYSLTGNARFQVGRDLPIPMSFAAIPNGGVAAIGGAVVFNGPGNALVFTAPSQLTHPGTKRVVPQFFANPEIFQVATAIAVGFPAVAGTLAPGGRSGPPTVTWCPGTAVPVAGAPGCGSVPFGGAIPGALRYTATGAQFGGALAARFSGRTTSALRATTPPPGNVLVINAIASPMSPGVIGAAFNAQLSRTHPAPGPASGLIRAFVTALGAVGSVVSPSLGPGLPKTTTSYGAPWTTGRITVSQAAASPPQTFVFSGSDARTPGGLGMISLVSGAITQRNLSGPQGNRGWLNLTISELTGVPAAPPGALAALAGLVALAAGHALRRRVAA